jgi:catalase
VQVIPEQDEFGLDFDLLDATKLIPEERVPVRLIGRMVLNRNPDNFFAETEQVAFHPGHLVPGIDFSNDPLLQGRLFSYTDTQLSRLGGPNFHELPINKAVCPMHNFQRDGLHRQQIAGGRVAYEPHSLGSETEFRVDGTGARTHGFASYPQAMYSPKARHRSDSFNDHFSQARMFWLSQTRPEQDHIVAAFQFELSKLETLAIRQRMVNNLAQVDAALAIRVARPLGIHNPDAAAAAAQPGFRESPFKGEAGTSPALSMAKTTAGQIATRQVAFLVANGVDGAEVARARRALTLAGAQCKLLSLTLGTVTTAQGGTLTIDGTLSNMPSVIFDAVYLPSPGAGGADLALSGDAVHFVLEAYKHCKAIAATASGAALLAGAGIALPTGGGVSQPQPGVLLTSADNESGEFVSAFIQAISQHRHWGRCNLESVAA